MMSPAALGFLLAAALAGPASSQDAVEALDLRVLEVRPRGQVVVDRGARDLVHMGDELNLQPLGRGPVRGRILRVDERTSLAQLDDKTFVPRVGMKGIVLVPVARYEEADEEQIVPAGPVRPPIEWETEDEDYEEGMPLLAAVDIMRPELRPARMSGRVYFITDISRSSTDDRSDLFLRTGTEVRIENPFGEGGALHFDGELNYRDTQVDKNSEVDQDFTKFRVNRASYAWGGTRWEPVRQEVGRFLQVGLPEFGVVDGYQWSRREDDGTSFGGSIGAFPEPNISMSTGDDYQVSGFYRWVADDSERIAATIGAQKTWHHGNRDRDLIVAKVHVLPSDGWDMHATAWVDYYASSDDVKDGGFELTQVYASATHRWDDGDGVQLTYRHQRFPELLRDEYLPVLAEQLADDRHDRLAARGWHWTDDDLQLLGELGVWDDEDDSGADAELGFELADLVNPGSRTTASVWASEGRFARSVGARVAHGRTTRDLSWDVAYEVSQHDNDDFDEDFADILQHWLRASWGWQLWNGWDASVSASVRVWDDNEEDGQAVHMYLSKNF